MVKFATDPKVYVITAGGILRHLTTQDIAMSLYGKYWNKWIDDVSDAFYTNYSFGQPIVFASDLNVVSAMNGISYPSESLSLAGVSPTALIGGFVCEAMDTDQDGLTDTAERTLGTDPGTADTDGDGFTDGVEVNSAHNPLGAG